MSNVPNTLETSLPISDPPVPTTSPPCSPISTGSDASLSPLNTLIRESIHHLMGTMENAIADDPNDAMYNVLDELTCTIAGLIETLAESDL